MISTKCVTYGGEFSAFGVNLRMTKVLRKLPSQLNKQLCNKAISSFENTLRFFFWNTIENSPLLDGHFTILILLSVQKM